jgi:WD40 repeat protein
MGVGICLTNNPHSLQWSPFQENLLAVATSNRPGHTPISGIIYFLEFLPKNNIEIQTQVQLNVGVNKIVWSHKNKNIVLCNCDDNVLRFFDLKNIECMYQEVYLKSKINSLDWDKISMEKILVGNNENYTTIFNLLDEEEEEPLYFKHKSNVLDSQFSTNNPNQFYSCDLGGNVNIWNQDNTKEPSTTFKLGEDNCAIGLDVNIYDEFSIALSWFVFIIKKVLTQV